MMAEWQPSLAVVPFNMTVEMQIRSEVYRAFENLGADEGLLATIGSWGDTIPDAVEVFSFS
jgi:hypothetical protein